MAKEYTDDYDDEDELSELRKRFIDAISPTSVDDAVWIDKAVLLIEGTDVESGTPAFTWLTWDRADDQGVATWTVLGYIDYFGEKMRALVPGVDGE